jgi:hypothetical protein
MMAFPLLLSGFGVTSGMSARRGCGRSPSTAGQEKSDCKQRQTFDTVGYRQENREEAAAMVPPKIKGILFPILVLTLSD